MLSKVDAFPRAATSKTKCVVPVQTVARTSVRPHPTQSTTLARFQVRQTLPSAVECRQRTNPERKRRDSNHLRLHDESRKPSPCGRALVEEFPLDRADPGQDRMACEMFRARALQFLLRAYSVEDRETA